MHGHIADKAPGALLRPQLRGQIRRNFDIFSRLNLSDSLTLRQNFSKFLEMRSISAANFFQNLFWDAALPQAEFSTHSLRQNCPKFLEMRSISTANLKFSKIHYENSGTRASSANGSYLEYPQHNPPSKRLCMDISLTKRRVPSSDRSYEDKSGEILTFFQD